MLENQKFSGGGFFKRQNQKYDNKKHRQMFCVSKKFL